MLTTLHLTAAEQKLFVGLSKEVTKGVKVVREEREFKDSQKDMIARRKVAHFESPVLQELQAELAQIDDEKEALKMMKQADLSDLPGKDLATLFFLMGPQILGKMVEVSLQDAKTVDDMKKVADLCEARSMLLEAFVPA